MAEPAYAFSLPSIEDELPLDCRIYHPRTLYVQLENHQGLRAAIVAHPYAPLGGCYDDLVVLSVTATLLERGYVVATFNFRGAGGSAGRTSWTGKSEQEDYASFIGFLVHYLDRLTGDFSSISRDGSQELGTVSSANPDSTSPQPPATPPNPSSGRKSKSIRLILAGYSYGSLILARLPPTSQILSEFNSAPLGTPAAAILLRARTLAGQTLKSFSSSSNHSPRDRGHQQPEGNLSKFVTREDAAKPARPATSSPVTLGSAEQSHGRRSKDSLVRRSLEAPAKLLKERVHHHRSSSSTSSIHDHQLTKSEGEGNPLPRSTSSPLQKSEDSSLGSTTFVGKVEVEVEVEVSYLLISPVLLPLTQTLCPPGGPSLSLLSGALGGFGPGGLAQLWRRRRPGPSDAASVPDAEAEVSGTTSYLAARTLAVFGSEDGFSSGKRLRGWAEGEAARVRREGRFEWEVIEGAGHFWREKGTMRSLRERIRRWIDEDSSRPR